MIEKQPTLVVAVVTQPRHAGHAGETCCPGAAELLANRGCVFSGDDDFDLRHLGQSLY